VEARLLQGRLLDEISKQPERRSMPGPINADDRHLEAASSVGHDWPPWWNRDRASALIGLDCA
jgi:hypothetical protein